MEHILVERIKENVNAEIYDTAEAIMARSFGKSPATARQLYQLSQKADVLLLGAFKHKVLVGIGGGKKLRNGAAENYLVQKGYTLEGRIGKSVGIILPAAVSLEEEHTDIAKQIRHISRKMLTEWGCEIIFEQKHISKP